MDVMVQKEDLGRKLVGTFPPLAQRFIPQEHKSLPVVASFNEGASLRVRLCRSGSTSISHCVPRRVWGSEVSPGCLITCGGSFPPVLLSVVWLFFRRGLVGRVPG